MRGAWEAAVRGTDKGRRNEENELGKKMVGKVVTELGKKRQKKFSSIPETVSDQLGQRVLPPLKLVQEVFSVAIAVLVPAYIRDKMGEEISLIGSRKDITTTTRSLVQEVTGVIRVD